MIRVIPANEARLPRFRDALHAVAQEKIYIEIIEAPPLERMLEFFKQREEGDHPNYFAIADDPALGEKVVGWADITPSTNPRLKHRGSLGMGLIEGYRGQGIGAKLLDVALKHAKRIGLEKVELTVYSQNLGAIALYKKFGFEQMGFIKNYRKLDGVSFDCVQMEKFL